MSIREFSRGGISGAIMGLTVVRPVNARKTLARGKRRADSAANQQFSRKG